MHIPGFTESNWTSSLKRYAYPDLPVFNDRDSISDFTYEDTTGDLAALLEIPTDGPKTFFIEIKTSKFVENCFTFSPKQFITVKKTTIKRK